RGSGPVDVDRVALALEPADQFLWRLLGRREARRGSDRSAHTRSDRGEHPLCPHGRTSRPLPGSIVPHIHRHGDRIRSCDLANKTQRARHAEKKVLLRSPADAGAQLVVRGEVRSARWYAVTTAAPPSPMLCCSAALTLSTCRLST